LNLQRWWTFLGLLFLAGVLLRVYPLAAFIVMLVLITALARWWQRRALYNVSYQRFFRYTRGFPGETVDMEVRVENRKFLPVPWLRTQDTITRFVGPQDENLLKPGTKKELGTLVSLFSLRWYQRDRRIYKMLLRERGVHRLGPARLEAGDLFGLFEQVDESSQSDYLTVYPKQIPFSALQLPIGDPFGDRRARRRLYEDTNRPMGVRDYRPEDDFRRIHWPATARTGQLQVKVYQPVSARVMVACLNVTTFENYWEGTDPALLEHLVRVTAAIVQQSMEDGYQVGLVSNGYLAHAEQHFRVLPGRSREQMTHLLTFLASLTPFVTGRFDRYLVAEASRLPYGATLVIITGLIYPALVETILHLKQHGRRITLLSFADESIPEIPGVNSYHFPYYGAGD